MKQESGSETAIVGESVLHFELFRVEGARRLWRGDQLVEIRPRPLMMLRYLAERPGLLVTKEELLKRLWPGIYVTKTVLKVCAREIRQALADDATTPRFLETVVTQGYRFIAPLTTTPTVPSSQFGVPSLESKGRSQQLTTGNWRLATHFVGREQELTLLHEAFAQAQRGERQVVFVSGEAGVGKTTLVDRFLDQVRASGPVRIGRGQCLDQHGQGEAYLPILEALSQLCRGPDGEHVIAALRRAAPMWLMQLPSIVETAEWEALQRQVYGSSQERMLREFAEALDLLAAETMVILVLEDLQWSDVSTLELVTYIAQRRGRARLQVVGTYRSADTVASGHPLRRIVLELHGHGQCEELGLELLTEEEVEEYLQRRFPQSSAVHTLGQVIHDRTDGNALFMASFVEDLIRKGILAETNGQWEVRAEVATVSSLVPASVQRFIAKQLEELSREEQLLLDIAAIAGMTFSAAEVAGVTGRALEDVEEVYETLANRKQFIETQGLSEWPDRAITARYGFRHALYQHVVDRRLGQAQQVRLHRQLAEWLATAHGERTHEIAGKLAVHYEQGRDYQQAVTYRLQAGENALRGNAYQETLGHGQVGLALLTQLPTTPERRQLELKLRQLVSTALAATRGFGDNDLEENLQRTQHICRELENETALVPAVISLTRLRMVRANRAAAEELVEQEYRLTESVHDAHLLVQLHTQLATTACVRGRHSRSEEHYQHVRALYDPSVHHLFLLSFTVDPLVVALGTSGLSLSLAGRLDQGWSRVAQGLAHAEALGQGFTLTQELLYAVMVKSLRGEDNEAWPLAQKMATLARQYALPLLASWGGILQGSMAVQRGALEEGIAAMTTGLAQCRAVGIQLLAPYFLSLLAEGYRRQEKVAEALQVVHEALSLTATNIDVFWEAELYRLKGQLTVQQFQVSSSKFQVPNTKTRNQKPSPGTQSPTPHPQQEAEACFLHAIEIARRQGAKLLELRAVMSLAHLWRQQGKPAAARQLLAEIYGWFTEGFDTADLQDAKALLASLT